MCITAVNPNVRKKKLKRQQRPQGRYVICTRVLVVFFPYTSHVFVVVAETCAASAIQYAGPVVHSSGKRSLLRIEIGHLLYYERETTKIYAIYQTDNTLDLICICVYIGSLMSFVRTSR